MAPKERREREKELRRLQILDAARTLLLEKGMNGIAMNQIAEAAELSVGALYLYFANKEEIFAALQEEGLAILERLATDAAGATGDPAERCRRLAIAYYRFYERHHKYYEIINYFLTAPQVAFPASLKAHVDAQGGRILKIVAQALAEATGAAADDPQTGRLALLFWSSLNGILQLRKLQRTILGSESLAELYRTGAERFITGLPQPAGRTDVGGQG